MDFFLSSAVKKILVSLSWYSIILAEIMLRWYGRRHLLLAAYHSPTVHYQKNDGKCGVCGDNWKDTEPRQHEAGGLYGNGFVVQDYQMGQVGNRCQIPVGWKKKF